MPGSTTRTGQFTIGFRSNGPRWRENLDQVIAFAVDNQFGAIDVGPRPPAELKKIIDAGLRIGTVDLPQPWDVLASADEAVRNDAADKLSQYITDANSAGAKTFFVVILANDAAAPRAESFAHAVAGWGKLCEKIASTDARIVIEGWPGPAPHFHSLVCTPEAYRTFIKEVGSPAMGVNFDPSHLVRMGIDPVRFVDEFADQSFHCHAKDTELFDDGLYEYGNLQEPIHGKSHGFGGMHWRYTIPGHGVTPWTRLFRRLESSSFEGVVSVELEDENFNGTDDGEKLGFIASRDYLKYC